MNITQIRDSIVTLLSDSPSLIGKYIFPDSIPGTEIAGYDSVVWSSGFSVGIPDYDDDEISVTSALPPDGYDEFRLSATEVPAVYVVGQKSVPNEWQVKGLEVAIRQYPEVLPEAGVGIATVLQQWETILVQYNPDGKEIADAMDRMARRFPDATFRYTPGDDVGYERCRIIIPDMTIRRLYAEP